MNKSRILILLENINILWWGNLQFKNFFRNVDALTYRHLLNQPIGSVPDAKSQRHRDLWLTRGGFLVHSILFRISDFVLGTL